MDPEGAWPSREGASYNRGINRATSSSSSWQSPETVSSPWTRFGGSGFVYIEVTTITARLPV